MFLSKSKGGHWAVCMYYIKDRMTFKNDRAECWHSKLIGCICSYNTFDGCLDAVCLTPRLPARSRQTTHQPEWQAKARLRLADRLYFYFKGLKMVHYSISSVWTTSKYTASRVFTALISWLYPSSRLSSYIYFIWYLILTFTPAYTFECTSNS